MYRSSITILLCLFCLWAFPQGRRIMLDNSKSNTQDGFRIERSNDHELRMSARIKAIDLVDVKNEAGEFCELQIDGSYDTGAEGEPQLPALRKLVQIPHGTIIKAKIACSDTSYFNLSDLNIKRQLTPRQPSQAKSDSVHGFVHKKRAYRHNYFTMQDLATVTKVGTMRGIDLYQIAVNPVRYNPKKNLLMVLNDIDIDIDIEPDAAKAIPGNASPYFENTYSYISNYKGTASDLTKYPVKYLIITDPAFVTALEDFIEWKRQKGFDVIVATTDTIGNTSAKIKAWIDKQYNSATNDSPAPSFLLLAADTDKIPTSRTGDNTGYGTDLYYACMDGADDIIPDLYYGRFSARTTEQMKAIVDKTITYEKYLFDDPSYLAKATLISGYDATYRSSVGIPTLNYIANNRINSGNGYKQVNKFTTKYTGCYSDTSVSVGLMTYTAHGTTTTWIDPELTQTKVNQFGNYGKFPFVIANCCLSGNINTNECLGETWLRKQNSGAVAYIGSIPKTYWKEDFYWAVGAHKYKSGVCPKVGETTIGAYDAPFVSDFVCGDAMLFAGNLAVTEAHDNSYPSDISTKYYWEAYNFLGDPSLLVYFGDGKDNTVIHESHIPFNQTSINVTAEVGSYVAITRNDTLIGASIIKDSINKNANINFKQILKPGEYSIVVTKSRYKPYIGNIKAILPNQPYILATNLISSKDISTGNTIDMDIALRNVGSQASSTSNFSISSNSKFVKSISASGAQIRSLDAYETDTMKNAYRIVLENNIPDKTIIPIDIAIEGGGQRFEQTLSLTVLAPTIYLSPNLTIENANSRIMPGDSVVVGITIENTGNATLKNATISLSANQSIVNLEKTAIDIPTLAPKCSTICQFTMIANGAIDSDTDFILGAIASCPDVCIPDTTEYQMRVHSLQEQFIGKEHTTDIIYPFNNRWYYGICQIIYTADDLGNSPKRIDEMAFDISYTYPGKEYEDFSNMVIKIRYTSDKPSEFFSKNEYYDMSDAQIVMNESLSKISVKGLKTFKFDTPFIYDGKSNIIIEITWGRNANYVPKDEGIRVYAHTTSFNSVGYDVEDSKEDLYLYKVKQNRPNTIFRYKKRESLVFNIKDSNDNPIPNCILNICDSILTTDDNGRINYSTYSNAVDFPYLVSAYGYVPQNGTISTMADSTNIDLNLKLCKTFNVSLQILHSSSNSEATNACINVIGKTYHTDSLGIVSIADFPEGKTPITITKPGYFTINDTVIISSDTSLTYYLKEYPNIKIKAVSGQDAISGATVIFDNDTLTTDNNGFASIKNIAPKTHKITITHNRFITLACNIDSRDIDIDTTFMLKRLPQVKFAVTLDNAPMANATIVIDDTSHTTDSLGCAIFTDTRHDAVLHYTIDGKDILPITDSFFVAKNDTTINLNLKRPNCKLQFTICDSTIPQKGININVLGLVVTTDDMGQALFENIKPLDTISYTISTNDKILLTNYTLYTPYPISIFIDLQQIDTVQHQKADTTHPIVSKHSILFAVSDKKKPMPEVCISVNDSILLTDSNGIATFISNEGELVNYTIRKDGYTTIDGLDEGSWSVICNKDTLIDIILMPIDTTGIQTAYTLTGIYPNPSNGTIHIPDEFIGCDIAIYDMQGLNIKTILATSNIIGLQPIKQGTYLMIATTPNGTVSNIIVVK